MQFSADSEISFTSVIRIYQDVNFGWVLRSLHANGARAFFVALYLHIARSMYYSRFKFIHTWNVGVSIFLVVIASAFLGYVLPWGQISFWGASVITRLIQAIPYIGQDIVIWLWGGFSVDNPTLIRFFTLHFFIPFFSLFLVFLHFIFLHQTGSRNPLLLSSNIEKIEFHLEFSLKDILGAFFFFILFFLIVFLYPWVLGDPENFILANPLITPVHIQPEWYFLFAYAILRSIPNKLGGVLALVSSVMILYLLPLMDICVIAGNKHLKSSVLLFWFLVGIFFLLTWIGARPVEDPYVIVGQILTFFYFFTFLFEFFIRIILRNLIYTCILNTTH